MNQLRAFLATVRLGSFTAAAAELGHAQASVSELIRHLEDEVGLPLFARNARRLVLTAAGRELLPFAEQSVAAADNGAQALRALRSLEGGAATFGVPRNAGYYFLSDLVETFCERHPQVKVRFVGLNSVDVAAGVVAGDLEAGLVILPVDGAGLSVTPLMNDEVVYASSDPEHVREAMTVAALSERRLILYDAHAGWLDPTRRQFAERAQLEGVRLEGWIEVEHVEAALSLVARGIGDTFISRAVAASAACPDNVKVVSFTEPIYDTIALIRRDSGVLSSATREIADMAQALLLDRMPLSTPVSARKPARSSRR